MCRVGNSHAQTTSRMPTKLHAMLDASKQHKQRERLKGRMGFGRAPLGHSANHADNTASNVLVCNACMHVCAKRMSCPRAGARILVFLAVNAVTPQWMCASAY